MERVLVAAPSVGSIGQHPLPMPPVPKTHPRMHYNPSYNIIDQHQATGRIYRRPESPQFISAEREFIKVPEKTMSVERALLAMQAARTRPDIMINPMSMPSRIPVPLPATKLSLQQLAQFPEKEIIGYVIENFNPNDVINMCSEPQLQKICAEEYFWMLLFDRDFSVTSQENYRASYLRAYHLLRAAPDLVQMVQIAERDGYEKALGAVIPYL